jgi:putative membrane protein
MKSIKLLSRFNVTKEHIETIREAVKSAEQKTSGEIALAVTGESHDYAFYELMVSVVFGALVFLIMLFYYNPIFSLINKLFWEVDAWQIIGLYGFVSFIAIAIAYALTNISAIDRIIIPKKARQLAVYQRALRHFVESGVYATKDHNGILLFISLMEHEVCIIADEGLLKNIAQENLNSLAQELADGIRRKELTESLLRCISSCGKFLETHYPIKKDDVNELPDGLVILN